MEREGLVKLASWFCVALATIVVVGILPCGIAGGQEFSTIPLESLVEMKDPACVICCKCSELLSNIYHLEAKLIGLGSLTSQTLKRMHVHAQKGSSQTRVMVCVALAQ